MLKAGSLKSLITKSEYTNAEKILLCLAERDEPEQVRDIRSRAVANGLRAAQKWNVSAVLASLGSLAARTSDGWELTDDGRKRVAELAGPAASTRSRSVAAGLRHHLTTVSNPETKAFLEEAIECLESGLYRAAVVLTWVGAVSVLQHHVASNRLADFNKEASRRDQRWKPAKTADGLGLMKEADFLNVISAIGVIGKNVKQELEGGLKLRNGCGHPNSLVVGEARTAAHVETLLLNVFTTF